MGGIIEAAVAIAATVGAAVGGGALVGAAIIATGVGMVANVVGSLTHTQWLSQIGLGLSVAGGVMGFGAAATSLFAPATGFEAVAPEVVGQSTIADTAVGTIAPNDIAAGGELGSATETAGTASNTLGVAAPGGQSAQTTEQLATQGTQSVGATPVSAQAPVGADTSAVGATPGDTSGGGMLQGPPTPATPNDIAGGGTPSTPGLPSIPNAAPNASDQYTMAPNQTTGLFNNEAIQGAGALDPQTKSWWASQPDNVKAAIWQGGISSIGSAAGGLFKGLQAEQQLALQKEIERNRQSQFQQVMTRATSTPGIIQFPRR